MSTITGGCDDVLEQERGGREFTTQLEIKLTTPSDGSVSLMGPLTANVSDTTLAVVEDGASVGSRQLE